MKAGELPSWLLTQQADLEVCIWNDANDDWLPMEKAQMQLRNIVSLPDD